MSSLDNSFNTLAGTDVPFADALLLPSFVTERVKMIWPSSIEQPLSSTLLRKCESILEGRANVADAERRSEECLTRALSAFPPRTR